MRTGTTCAGWPSCWPPPNSNGKWELCPETELSRSFSTSVARNLSSFLLLPLLSLANLRPRAKWTLLDGRKPRSSFHFFSSCVCGLANFVSSRGIFFGGTCGCDKDEMEVIQHHELRTISRKILASSSLAARGPGGVTMNLFHGVVGGGLKELGSGILLFIVLCLTVP